MSDEFYKFPTTPHLITSTDIDLRIEKVLSKELRDKFANNCVTVEEKIDGANLGISFNNNGQYLFQNRGKYLTHPFVGQWKALPDWFINKADIIFDVLENNFILFGEWCYAKHSIFYNCLPDWFIAFDIYDRLEEKFLSVNNRNILLNRMNLTIAPMIHYGIVDPLNIESLLRKSHFGDDLCEGLYFRLDYTWLELRAKYVRPNFVQTIDQHWSKEKLVTNCLSNNAYYPNDSP